MGALNKQESLVDRPAGSRAAKDNRGDARRVFPAEAVARIYKPSRSVTTSGRGRTKGWRLVFERRTPPVIEPLMGYTAGNDPLVQVELSFPTLAAALAYAERNCLTYRVEGEEVDKPVPSVVPQETGSETDDALAGYLSLAWIQTRYGLGGPTGLIDLDRAMLDPAAVFAEPCDVLFDPSLTLQNKRDILQRWAWDEYLVQLASDEAMPEGEASRLDQVKSALLALEGEQVRVALVRTTGSMQPG